MRKHRHEEEGFKPLVADMAPSCGNEVKYIPCNENWLVAGHDKKGLRKPTITDCVGVWCNDCTKWHIPAVPVTEVK